MLDLVQAVIIAPRDRLTSRGPDNRNCPGCAEMENPSFALVTGASQGLGRVCARALAARKQNVILVARSKDKLEKLANELRSSQSVLAEVLEFDLTSVSAGSRLVQQLHARNLQVDLLVNNAGFGVRGDFQALALQRQMEMLSLNNTAVVEL